MRPGGGRISDGTFRPAALEISSSGKFMAHIVAVFKNELLNIAARCVFPFIPDDFQIKILS